MFSRPLLRRRCVIPSTGFYEWAHIAPLDEQMSFFPIEIMPRAKDPKVKLHFRNHNEPMLYMAGMIDTFADKDGKAKDAFIILTAAANASMEQFHDRMPVILAKNECEEWISSEAFMREVLARESAELIWAFAA